MNFLHKKIWIAWSKFRFLRLPVERRVRLEVTTDGRHITFLLVSLYEAGYGVQVLGSPVVFRELICLRKSAPIPFVVGGKEYEVGISITDQPSTLDAGRSSLFVLDYDYFSGLSTPRRQGSRSGDCRGQPERARREGSSESTCPKRHESEVEELTTIERQGGLEKEQPQVGPKGEGVGTNESKSTEDTEVAAGLRLPSQASAEFSNPFTSELAQDSENTSLIRSANGPAEEALRAEMQRSGNIEPRMTRIYTDGQQGDAQGTCAGDAFSNPSTSELARASGNTSLTRCANNPALAYRVGELGSDGGNQPADSMEFLEGQSQAGLQMDNQKDPTIRTANGPTAPEEYSSSVYIRDIRGKNSSSLDTGHSPPSTALRAPYFMHPSVYHRGLHKSRSPSTAFDSAAKQRRRFRIGFFGTHDRDFYTKHYHFPGMNRFEILEAFFEKFGDSFVNLEGAPQDWKAAQIAVSIDSQGGDRKGKTFLSQDHYFEALQECDFVLSPPGICTPLSHSLIEAIFCGAIPITNAGVFMTPPLEDGRHYLEFYNSAGFSDAIEKALAMTDNEILELRLAAFDYYRRFLNPVAFGHSLEVFARGRLLVNAEEKSVPFIYPRFIWPPKS